MNQTAANHSAEFPPVYTEKLGNAGPTIVMLHGWGRSLEALRPLGDLLAQDYRVILLDLPGFGRSPLPHPASNEGGGWNTADYAERVAKVLTEMGITQCILVGHSFGGRVSLRLASKHPNLVTALVLIGSHGLKRELPLQKRWRTRVIKTLVSVAKSIDGAFGTRLFAHYLAPRVGSRDYNAAGDLRRTFVKTVNEDQAGNVATIRAPTLLLWGEDDQETPLDLARNFKRLLSNSELHVFPHKGHEPFADVGCHLMAQYILHFLSSRGLRDC